MHRAWVGLSVVLFSMVLGACGGETPMADAGSMPDAGGTDAFVLPCPGMPSGTSCGDGLICREGLCVTSVCGDGFVDPVNGEDCEDGNADAFDGCEPVTCEYTCADDSHCNDGIVCNGDETCSETEHVCEAGTPATDGASCTMQDTTAGACRSGACVKAECGNALVDPGESCDDGNTTSRDGCELDCRFTCESVEPSLLNTWFVDCDGDGFAERGAPSVARCEEPAPVLTCVGWTTTLPLQNSIDCDDAAVGRMSVTCFPDDDDDGYARAGAPVAFTERCGPVGDGAGYGGCPTGTTSRDPSIVNNADCNDGAESISPAATEQCSAYGESDEDCDGMVDEGMFETRSFYVDEDGDRFAPGASPVAVTMTVLRCQEPDYAPPGHCSATPVGTCRGGSWSSTSCTTDADCYCNLSNGDTGYCWGTDVECDSASDCTFCVAGSCTNGSRSGDPCSTNEDCFESESYGCAIEDECRPGDCCDTDSEANPSAYYFRATQTACGSFDWNCDGAETPVRSLVCNDYGSGICGNPDGATYRDPGPIYTGPAPACGSQVTRGTCVYSEVCDVAPAADTMALPCQ
jgi:cysteine-rich repeat protein